MTELRKQLRYFKGYKILPIIFACATFISYFVWGIIDSTFENPFDGTFGVMQLPNAFLCWFIWALIGAVLSVITFFFWRVIFSYHLLHIHYLQKITYSNTPIDNTDSDDTTDSGNSITNEESASHNSPFSLIYQKKKNSDK